MIRKLANQQLLHLPKHRTVQTNITFHHHVAYVNKVLSTVERIYNHHLLVLSIVQRLQYSMCW